MHPNPKPNDQPKLPVVSLRKISCILQEPQKCRPHRSLKQSRWTMQAHHLCLIAGFTFAVGCGGACAYWLLCFVSGFVHPSVYMFIDSRCGSRYTVCGKPLDPQSLKEEPDIESINLGRSIKTDNADTDVDLDVDTGRKYRYRCRYCCRVYGHACRT